MSAVRTALTLAVTGLTVAAIALPGSALAPASARTSHGSPAGATASQGNARTTMKASVVGPAGVGDTYYPEDGNGGYDVSHYDLRLRYQPDAGVLSGTATLTLRPTAPLGTFNLDFATDPTLLLVNGEEAKFSRSGTELTVTPAEPLDPQQLTTVVVNYSLTPATLTVAGRLNPWQVTPDGVLAADEPEMAPWWFPCNNHPRDKATFDISVAAPRGLQVLSNGLLTGQASAPGGLVRWSWRSLHPTATYLAFLAIGEYDVHKTTTAEGDPVITAYSQSLGGSLGAAQSSVERTSEIVDFLAGKFGPYPFESRGGVVVPHDTITYALENQTRPVYAPEFFDAGANTYVVAHENAHQWFGDSTSVHDWRDIWLNEGFATYAEWLWSEHIGEGTAQEVADYVYASHPEQSDFWQVIPGDPGKDDVFSEAVYDRGALALHALRRKLGDEMFFTVLRTWLSRRIYSNGTVQQFIAQAEDLTGQDLQQLFETWLYTPGRPPAPSSSPALTQQRSRRAADGEGSPSPRVVAPRSMRMIEKTGDLLTRQDGAGR